MKNLIKKTLLLSLVLMSLTATFNRAQAIGISGYIGIGVGVLAVGATIYAAIDVGDEWSATTAEISGRVYNKQLYVRQIEADALAVIAGEQASAMLSATFENFRDREVDGQVELIPGETINVNGLTDEELATSVLMALHQ